MAKIRSVAAGPDDPIYNGSFVISSKKSKNKPITLQESSPTDTTGRSVQSPKEEKSDE